MLDFREALKGNFYHLSLNGKNTPHFTILTPNTLSDFKIKLENSKKQIFLTNFKTFAQF